jgi:hypothetical protein
MTEGVLVTGVACAFRVNGRRLRHVSGPAMHAAIGARLVGPTPVLATRVPDAAVEHFTAICHRLGIDASGVVGTRNEVEWSGAAVSDEDASVDVTGEPEPGLDAASAADWRGGLVVANTNPVIARRWIAHRAGAFTAIDMFHGWVRFLGNSCHDCIREADLVTLTAREAGMLASARPIALRDDAILVTKHGRDGVHVSAPGRSAWLPPPQVDHVRCDIGAGDLLLGALAAAASQVGPAHRFEAVVDAYDTIRPALALLLSSEDPDAFIDALAGGAA